MIDPKQVIREHTVEELQRTADGYFKCLKDPTTWMVKPFYSLVEAPALLQNSGLLLSGLRLGKTMTVLDFGAGSCWFSRILAQLQCNPVCCDVSDAALEIGRRLFKELPPLGASVGQPRFLSFNGREIDLPDESVDRVVCNDAFHHVPNQAQVLSEFARILRPGGIAGFSEPGKHHAFTSQSQMEMRNFGVLENNIDLDEIFTSAKEGGFTRISCRLLGNMELTLAEYHALTDDSVSQPSPASAPSDHAGRAALASIRRTMTDQTIFFLYKGDTMEDSRSHVGLAHKLELDALEFEIGAGETINLNVAAHNVGSATWLCMNAHGIGVVNLGAQLYDAAGHLIDLNFSRHGLGSNVLPGETEELKVSIPFAEKGIFQLAIDLVSEGVCWFEILGCQPVYVRVVVV
jgi:ubiquinone/menaquinone biosynthesis C-methylase UbiE